MVVWDQLLLLLTVEFLANLTADVLLWENGYYANRSFVFLWMLKLTKDGVRTSRGPRGSSCPGAGVQPGCSEAQGYPELDDGHRCCIPIYKSSQQQGRVSLPAMSREHWQSSLPGKKWHLTTPTCTGGVSVTRIAVAHNLTQPISVLQSLSQSHTEAHTDPPLCSGFPYAHTFTHPLTITILWLLPLLLSTHSPPAAEILSCSSSLAPRTQGPCDWWFDSGFWHLHQSLQTSSCSTANTWSCMTKVPPSHSLWAPHSSRLLAGMHGLSPGSYSCCWYLSNVPTS